MRGGLRAPFFYRLICISIFVVALVFSIGLPFAPPVHGYSQIAFSIECDEFSL